jgi:hypothetical protein
MKDMDAVLAGMGRKDGDEPMEERAMATIEGARLRRLLIQAGKSLPPLAPDQLEAVFQRIVAQLEDGERRGIPVARIEPPSGTAHAL